MKKQLKTLSGVVDKRSKAYRALKEKSLTTLRFRAKDDSDRALDASVRAMSPEQLAAAIAKAGLSPVAGFPPVVVGGTGTRGTYVPLTLDTPTTTVLQEANTLIYGEKESEYGHPKKNLNHTALLWDAYMRVRYGESSEPYAIVAEDVCHMMALLKIARAAHNPKRDSLVDAAGYLGLVERIREG